MWAFFNISNVRKIAGFAGRDASWGGSNANGQIVVCGRLCYFLAYIESNWFQET